MNNKWLILDDTLSLFKKREKKCTFCEGTFVSVNIIICKIKRNICNKKRGFMPLTVYKSFCEKHSTVLTHGMDYFSL